MTLDDPNVIQEPSKTEHSELSPVSRRVVPELQLVGVQLTGDLSKLFGAMARAQANFKPIERTRHVEVTTKDKGKYEFDYAPHENVIAATRGAMNAEGLCLIQLNPTVLEPGKELDEKTGAWVDVMQMVDYLHTIVGHESGAAMALTARLGSYETPQKYGSALTYGRRYTEQCVTGSSAEYDEDGNDASGNRVDAVRNRAPKERPPTYREMQEATQKQQWGAGKAPEPHPHAPPEEAAKGPSKAIALNTLIREEFLRLKHVKGNRAAIITMDATGKEPNELNEEDQKKLLEHLRGLPTPKQE